VIQEHYLVELEGAFNRLVLAKPDELVARQAEVRAIEKMIALPNRLLNTNTTIEEHNEQRTRP